ncbi:MAG TPA: glycosyltransferase family 39 protein [Phnomibacter sp.]|nr:glycosyltransferase family 39 protein [Phnomibacter sp.]
MKSARQLLLLLTLVRLVLPFVLQHPIYQPHRDEFLYLDYGRHMDWGYMEVPPLLSVFSWMVQQLGLVVFHVKLFPALIGAATFLLCGQMVLLLGGNRLSMVLLFMAFVCSAFLRVFHLFQPGFLEVFCWTLIGYTLVRYQLSQHTKWLWMFGLACGLGMMSKYTTAFYISGLLLALLLTPQRSIFLRKEFWLACGLALLIFLPNIWWQYMHNFPVVHHMHELRETQLVHISASDFLKDQWSMHLPVVFIWITALLILAIGKWGKTYRWLACQYVLVITLLILGSGKGYYALGLYPILFAFGAAFVGLWLAKQKRIMAWAIMIVPILLGLVAIPHLLPMFPPQKQAAFYNTINGNNEPSHQWEDLKKHPLPQDFADMMGWKEIAAMVAKQYHALPDSMQQHTMLYCRGYFTASALNYYRHTFGLPEAHSDNGSYLLWMPDSFSFKHLLLVGRRMPDSDDEVFNHFKSRQILDSLQLPLAREDGMRVIFFKDGDSDMNRLVAEGIAEEKKKFSRE